MSNNNFYYPTGLVYYKRIHEYIPEIKDYYIASSSGDIYSDCYKHRGESYLDVSSKYIFENKGRKSILSNQQKEDVKKIF